LSPQRIIGLKLKCLDSFLYNRINYKTLLPLPPFKKTQEEPHPEKTPKKDEDEEIMVKCLKVFSCSRTSGSVL